MNNLDFIKIKNVCSVKDTNKRRKTINHKMAGNICKIHFHQKTVFRIQGTVQNSAERNKQCS